MKGIEVSLGMPITRENLTFAKQMGLKVVHTHTPAFGNPEFWDLADLKNMVELAAEYGLTIRAVENTPANFYDKLLWGLPGRERQLDNYIKCIENLSLAGIHILGYHFMPTSVWRDKSHATVRGSVKFTQYHKDTIDADGPQPHNACPAEYVGADVERMWDNYAYFLEGILPAAREYDVKLALHPDDPPQVEIGGVKRMFYDVEQYKRGWKLAGGDPYWGLDFCMGSISELNGAESVKEIIDFFAPKGQIFYCHFRDVKGCLCKEGSFHETFLGEGNYDPAEMLIRLADKGFTGHLIDDHVGAAPGDTANRQMHAHAIGYMQGMVRMADTLRGEK